MSGYEPDESTLKIMRANEQRWALEAGHESAAYSDWRRDESKVIHTEVDSDGVRRVWFDNGGFSASGPTRRVGVA